MSKKSLSSTIVVRLSQSQMEKINRICAESGLTVSAVIRALLAKV